MGWSVGMYIHNNSIRCSRYYAPSLNERLEVECYLQVGTFEREPICNQLLFSLGAKGDEARAATGMELWSKCCCGLLSVPLMDAQMWAGDLALSCDRQQGVGG